MFKDEEETQSAVWDLSIEIVHQKEFKKNIRSPTKNICLPAEKCNINVGYYFNHIKCAVCWI